MPKPTIDQIRAIGDVAVRYNWQLQFATLPPGSTLTSSEIDVRAVSTKIPSSSVNNVPINIRGHVVNQPGTRSYGDTLPLTLVEGVDTKVANFLHNWMERCWQTGIGYQESRAGREAEIILFLLNLQNNPIRQYRLIGCYLESYDPGSVDASSNDAITHDITIRYDYSKESA